MSAKKQLLWMFAGYSLFIFVLLTSFYSSIILEGLPYVSSTEQLVYRIVSLCAYIALFALFVFVSRWQRVWCALHNRLRVPQLVGITFACGALGALLLSPLGAGTLGLWPAFIAGTIFVSLALAPMQLFWLAQLVDLSYRSSYLVVLGVNAVATVLNASLLMIWHLDHGLVTLVAFVLSGLCALMARRGKERWIGFEELGAAPEGSALGWALGSNRALTQESSLTSASATALASTPASTPASAAAPAATPAATSSTPPVLAKGLSSQQIPIIVSLLSGGVVAVGLFAFASGLMSLLSGQTTTTPSSLQGYMLIAGISVTVIMAVPAIVTKRPLQLENSYRLALPLSALGFLVIPQLIGTLPDGVPGVLVSTGYMVVGIVLYCTIAEVARTARVSPALLYAACGVATLACNLLGICSALPLGSLLAEQQNGFATFALALLYLMILGGSWLVGRLRNKGDFAQKTPDKLKETQEKAVGTRSTRTAEEADSLEATIDEAQEQQKSGEETYAQRAAALGLSSKETEVFERLMRGRTLARIGEELFLSTSAVKYHTQNIYQKLGVGSREEFFRLERSGSYNSDAPANAHKKRAAELVEHIATEKELTQREQDVLYNFALGNTVVITAKAMGVSENTVKTHAKNLYAKLGVRSKQGIIDLMQ